MVISRGEEPGAYLPIEDYGLIGNMRTAALVGRNGSIDWLCYPRFDSPSVFAKILDSGKGGSFSISPTFEGANNKQFYWPDSNVLVTRFLSPEGVAQIEDFMPVSEHERLHNEIVRRVRVPRGCVHFKLRIEPRYDYARLKPSVSITKGGAVFSGPDLKLALGSAFPLTQTDQGAEVMFELSEGESATFVLSDITDDQQLPSTDPERAEALFESTARYWRDWLSQCKYTGRWREMVHRSALTLKLLTYEPTGAIVAAPTCSLPESIGGERNWDYRYTWIRDAAFTLYALLRLGFTSEASAFMSWLDSRFRESSDNGPLQIVYGIEGHHELNEYVLPHLEGYRGSKPVRIGNGAHSQLQLDIYGELLDSVYLYNKYGSPISYEAWKRLCHILDWLGENWDRADEGVWEVRGPRQHFVFSKLMSWVAFDRGLRLADKRSLPADNDRWRRIRNAIYKDIMTKGWSENRQAFSQAYGSDCLDASNLIMPLVFFIAPDDPKMLSTIDAISRTPTDGGLVSDGLVYRYDTDANIDGLEGNEGSFNMCSFWLVEAQTRAGKTHPVRLESARFFFERMLGYSNHLGLYAEETGPSGEALGNYPQAFTHLGLISAAYNLDRALNRR